MNLHAVYHRPYSEYAYAYSDTELHLRLRTAKNDVQTVKVTIGNKFYWQKTKKTFEMRKIASDTLFDYYQYAYHTEDPRIGYYFDLYNGAEKTTFTEAGFLPCFDEERFDKLFFQYPYINKADVHRVPSWVQNAVFYQIFPDRFYNGDPSNDPEHLTKWGKAPGHRDFYGGDLSGILQKLDYLETLGINCIYLTPIFSAPSNHKYDTVDYTCVDPSFGTIETLKELTEKAHSKGMRIILDAVFNHTSKAFPPFEDVRKNREKSKYKDWFFFDRLSAHSFSYRTFGKSENMPKLNTENKECRAFLLQTAEKWMKETDIDGWRLDVSDEIDHAFWREFRKTVKSVNPNAVIIGENWHDSTPWLQGDQFDGVMNYTVSNLCLYFFGEKRMSSEKFAQEINTCLMRSTDQANTAMMNLLDSHDTPRFLTQCKGDKAALKLASAFLFSMVGMPCIYYGTEIGMEGGKDPDCRRTFDWDEKKWDHDLLSFYQNLIALRKRLTPLQSGFVRVYEKDGAVIVRREHLGQKVYCIFNNADRNFTLPNPVQDLLSGQRQKNIPPFSAFFFEM